MTEKMYKCAYTHCLHHGQKIPQSEAVEDNGKRYHWDCLQTKQDLTEIRRIYYEFIADDVKFPVLAKVLNDLIFKYEFDIDYIKFIVCFIACNYKSKNHKIKSPFTLISLAKEGQGIREKYENNADWWWENFNRKGIN